MAGWFGRPSLAPVAKLVGVVGAEVSVAPDVELMRQNGGISGCGRPERDAFEGDRKWMETEGKD